MKQFARLEVLKNLPPESDESQKAIADIQRHITDHLPREPET